MKFLKTLLGCFFTWHVKPDLSKIHEAQAIIGFSVGEAGNLMLASVVRQVYTAFPLPPILQWEISDKLKRISPYTRLTLQRHGQYLDIREVAYQASQICQEKGWTKVIVVGHPHHLWRCVKTIEKLGLEVIGTPDTLLVPYESKKNKRYFLACEVPVRLYYLFKNWI